ncbi:MAG TPA: CHAT domain-containing protein, partial [Pyrinomonadaceae bacterium]|nr:CHAT domain-containing protein [Pyrinomonadaceae bacterium]
ARNVTIFDENGNGGGQKKNLTLSLTDPLPEAAAKEYGDKLREALFKPRIAELWGAATRECKKNAETALRIRLDLTGAPELAVLPWEYMRATDGSNFVGLDEDTTLVRYLRGSGAGRPLRVLPPLRVLVVASSPNDLPPLDASLETDQIKQAFAKLAIENVQIDILEKATYTGLKAALEEARKNETPFHIFHFIGHGAFDEEKNEGFLLFEDDNGKSAAIGHEALGRLLQPYRTDLRLAVLNACEGARLSVSDSYSSVAAKLMQVAEIPAVIAMQFAVTDAAAIIFATVFYSQIAAGESLERAIDVARLAVDTEDNYTRLNKAMRAEKEWATPVFYLRAKSGFLFEVKVPKAPEELEFHYEDLIPLLKRCYLVVFLGLEVNLLNRPYYDPWEPGKGLPSTAELCSYLSRQLKISPPRDSLAGLAKQLELRGIPPTPLFRRVFKNLNKPTKLYEVLSEITKKIYAELPDTVTDPCHCATLFVTTTYDFALEAAFQKAGITEYDTVTYAKYNDVRNEEVSEKDDRNSKWIFFHKRYKINGDQVVVETVPLVEPHTPNKYEGLRNKSPIILKLPGEVSADVLDNSGFAITEDDFFNFGHKELSALLPADLLGQLNSSFHLYIGYDLQSWTLRLLWNRICENQSVRWREGSCAVVADEDKDPNVPFWRENVIRRVAAGLDDYVEGLEEFVLRRL